MGERLTTYRVVQDYKSKAIVELYLITRTDKSTDASGWASRNPPYLVSQCCTLAGQRCGVLDYYMGCIGGRIDVLESL